MEEVQVKDEEKAMPASGASASDTFCQTMCGMISQKDVDIIQSMQSETLSKFEKTNEKFDKFNRLSAERYNRLHSHFQNHTKMLLDMKKDLDVVFRRIRNLKIKLTKQYGDAFKATAKSIHELEEELEALQSGTGHIEEKPQTNSQLEPEYTSAVGQNTPTQQNTQRQITGGNQAAGTSASKEESSTQKNEQEQNESQEKKAVYKTKLKPQLSSSDESYGTESDNDDSDDKDSSNINSSDDGNNKIENKSGQEDNTLSSHNSKQNSDMSTRQHNLQETFSSSDESLESDSDVDNSNEQLEFETQEMKKSEMQENRGQ